MKNWSIVQSMQPRTRYNKNMYVVIFNVTKSTKQQKRTGNSQCNDEHQTTKHVLDNGLHNKDTCLAMANATQNTKQQKHILGNGQ